MKAAVAFPILGTDFLTRYKLAVDDAGLQLTGKKVRIPLVAPVVGSIFVPVGIRFCAVEVDLVGVGRGSKKWILQVWARMAAVVLAAKAAW